MLHKIYVLFFICILLNSCNSKSKLHNDLTESNLNGKVKFLSINCYTAIEISGEIKKGDKGREHPWVNDGYVTFNKNGNKILEYIISSDFPLSFKANYYDANNRLIEKYWYTTDSILLERRTYKYDDLGNLITEWSYSSDDSSKYTYVYNDEGERAKKFFYNSKETGSSKTTYKYNRKGKLIEEIDYNNDGSLRLKIINKYSLLGNRIVTLCLDENGFLLRKYNSKYDKADNIIEERYFESYDSTTQKHNYKYIYDKWGNWIVQIIFIKGIPKYYYERKIEYY
jgi:hypothetical protein